MSNDSEYTIDPIQVLQKWNDDILSRYDSFNQKLGMYLTVLAIVSSFFFFVFQNQLPNIVFVFKYDGLQCDQLIVHIVLSCLFSLFSITLIVLLVLLVKEILQALQPIRITTIDEKAIGYWNTGKKKKATETLISDLLSTARANNESLNKKYDSLYRIRACFIWFSINYLIMMVLLVAIVFYGSYRDAI